MKIWLDDERAMPPFYDVQVKTAEEAIEALKTKLVTHISLDHDLGEERTGYDVAKFIENRAFRDLLPPIEWAVHSQNPVGKKNITVAMSNADRYWRK